MSDEQPGPAPGAESLTTYAFGPRDRAGLAAWAAAMGLAVEEDSETRGRQVRLAARARSTILVGDDLFAPGRALAPHTERIRTLTVGWHHLDAATFLPALAAHLAPGQGAFLITWLAETPVAGEAQQLYLPAYVLHPDGRYIGGDLSELAAPALAFGRHGWHPYPQIDLPLYDHDHREWLPLGYHAEQAAWRAQWSPM